MPADKLHQTLQLSNGRTLSYAEYGAPGGKAVLYFHGSPGSRLELGLFENIDVLASRLNARLIAVDRPGFGQSTFQPGRKFVDWPQDVSELADRLSLERFGVMSYSAGGPYAAVCALQLADRLSAAGLVSSPCPFTVPGAMEGFGGSRYYWLSAKIHPWLTEQMLKQAVKAPRNQPPAQQASMMAAEDYALFLEDGMYARFVELTFAEATCGGARGPAYEATLYNKPWGFRLEDIPMLVHLWHGDKDQNAPIGQGRYLARTIPQCAAKFYPGEGHFSLYFKYIEDILSTLVA